LRDVGNFDWLILTSVNGVDALFERLEKLRIEPAKLNHLQVAAIGPATQRAIERHGLKVAVTPENILPSQWSKRYGERRKGSASCGAGQNRARRFAHELKKTGAAVEVVERMRRIFNRRQSQIETASLPNAPARPDIVTFTSSSTAKNFLSLLDKEHRHALREVWLASIGPVTSATLRSAGFQAEHRGRGIHHGRAGAGHCQASAAWA